VCRSGFEYESGHPSLLLLLLLLVVVVVVVVVVQSSNRLMLFGETVAVYCENHTEHRYSPYLTGNTLSPLQSPTG
jgi:hypothetical protein